MAFKIVYLLCQGNKQPNSIVMLHNHLGQSGFSLNDIKMFIENKSIRTLTIVTNYSVVKYISKTLLYNKSQVYKIMKYIKHSIITRNNESIVDNILKRLYNNMYIK